MAQAELTAAPKEVAPPRIATPANRHVRQETVSHARIRAVDLIDRDATRAPIPQRLVATLVRAWRWLAHSIRIALLTDQSAQRVLVQDPAGLRTLIQRTRVALVTTRDRGGSLHSEPMEASERDFDGVIWFPASESAPVLERVRARAAVQLTYHDKDSNRCVVLDGIARVCEGSGRRTTGRFIRVDVVSADAWD